MLYGIMAHVPTQVIQDETIRAWALMLHLERSIKAHGHGGLRRPNGQENTYTQQTGCATKSQ